MNWDHPEIRQLVALALEEDRARDDRTTKALIPAALKAFAVIRSKQQGVVAGLPLAAQFFRAVSRSLTFRGIVHDGERVQAGNSLAEIHGNARALLSAERPALNALQHLSGIATFTRQQVDALGSSKTKLFDTRKTLPGWRMLEKYAVRCGGGQNHRMTLSDAVLVKENHLKLARMAGTNWVEKMRAFRQTFPAMMVQIEVQTDRDLQEAIRVQPQRILLDNMSTVRLKKAIALLRRHLPKTEIEISGGVRPDQLRGLSRLGVERISMGRLTHSAPAFDCSLDFQRVI